LLQKLYARRSSAFAPLQKAAWRSQGKCRGFAMVVSWRRVKARAGKRKVNCAVKAFVKSIFLNCSYGFTHAKYKGKV
jgi:hypothetical protein